MSSALPRINADPELVRVCDAVGRGHLRTMDGVTLVRDKMEPLLNGCTDINKMSVIAVLVVEELHPGSNGVLLDRETMEHMWSLPQGTREIEPELHMAFLVLSCLQLTSMGERHEGAKAMTQAIDRMLPDEPTINI